MAVVKTSIAAVSYLNTVPFIYGIRHADKLQAELLLAPPSACARNFIDRKADIALVPAGASRLWTMPKSSRTTASAQKKAFVR